MSRIAVVGAGPAGCVATQRLITAGHSVVLFEQGVGLDGSAAARSSASFSDALKETQLLDHSSFVTDAGDHA